MKGERHTYKCSFCGKSQEAVHRLIAGPGGVYICNECVSLCTEIIGEEQAMRDAQGDTSGWVKTSGHREGADPQFTPHGSKPDPALQELLAPLVDELSAARATIERLAGENGALHERIRALETEKG